MFCSKCGKEISSGSKFCKFCGNGLDSNTGQSYIEPTTIKYAGFWIRFAAYFIDYIIASMLAATISAIFYAIGLDILGALVYLVAWFGYFIILTYEKNATWGKMAVGISVVSEDKEKLSIGKVILRETAGKIVSSLILCIGYIMAGLSENKQALHDKIAKTYVIYKNPKSESKTWIIVLIAIPIFIAVIGILASIVLVSLSSAREKANYAAFKAEVSSIVPSMIISCDENNFISINDLGAPKHFDPKQAIRTLTQNCNSKNGGSFSITINGMGTVAPKGAVCTEDGCTFE
jgi:uncharacterized RDD family membrane protein YckC